MKLADLKLLDLDETQTEAKLIATAKRNKAKRANPKASKTVNMKISGSRPSDQEASMGSTVFGSRHQDTSTTIN